MIEYRDGHFSDQMDLNDALAQLVAASDENVLQNIKALHIGTPAELDEIKQKKDLQDQLDELTNRVEKLEPLQSEHIHIPENSDIERYS